MQRSMRPNRATAPSQKRSKVARVNNKRSLCTVRKMARTIAKPVLKKQTRTMSLSSQDYTFLKLSRNGPTVTVTMNRPDVHNAFNETFISELTTAFKSISKNVQDNIQQNSIADSNPHGVIRSVILASEGPSFSAGADLNWMKKMAQYSEAENKQDAGALYDMFKAISDCPVPVIARIQGVALGGGAGLVAVADIAIAVEEAKIGFTEVAIGLIPAVISRFCTEKIGTSASARYFVTGERFSATEAKRIGLVHEVFPTIEEVDKTVNKIASIINNNSPNAVRSAKTLWKEVLGGHHGLANPNTRDYTTSTIAQIRVSPEGQAGLNSFLNKAPAPWKLEGSKKQ